MVIKAVGFALLSAAFPPEAPKLKTVKDVSPLLTIVAFAALDVLREARETAESAVVDRRASSGRGVKESCTTRSAIVDCSIRSAR